MARMGAMKTHTKPVVGAKKNRQGSKGKGNGKGREKGVMMWVPVSQANKIKAGMSQKQNSVAQKPRFGQKFGQKPKFGGRFQRRKNLAMKANIKPAVAMKKVRQGSLKGKGNGKGKEKGKMMWVPVSQASKVKGGAKGGVRQKGRSPRENSGGHRRKPRVAAEKKIWLAGLPVIEDWEKRKEASQKLKEQFKISTDCVRAEIWRNGHGFADFATEEDAQVALATFAGTKFRGSVIEVDVWEKSSK